ncbi:MAG: hypothetical protein KGI50_06650 [Patescibacteria group bacterium]|nr:hypothetical protein [Patescibacteria group bacterium]MDE2439108.1 hypothetical protein [Patescibacteria group bacterium]
MKVEFRRKLSRFLIVAGLLWLVAFCASACGPVDGIFTAVDAALSGVGLVLTALGTAISPAVTAAIEDAVNLAQTAVAALKTAVDAYEADTTDTTKLAKVKAALQAVQNALPQLLTAANINNATLQSWIEKVVALATSLLNTIVTSILPAVEGGALEVEGERAALEVKATDLKDAFVSGYDAALIESGLPAEVQNKAHTDFHHRIARHIGPVRI